MKTHQYSEAMYRNPILIQVSLRGRDHFGALKDVEFITSLTWYIKDLLSLPLEPLDSIDQLGEYKEWGKEDT